MVFESRFAHIEHRLANIEHRLANIEKWIPVENLSII